jgi:hypothetical protein
MNKLIKMIEGNSDLFKWDWGWKTVEDGECFLAARIRAAAERTIRPFP